MSQQMTRQIALMTIFATCILIVALLIGFGLGANADAALSRPARHHWHRRRYSDRGPAPIVIGRATLSGTRRCVCNIERHCIPTVQPS